jgi:nucleoside 2-deoxyribosyltransferase
MVILTAQLFVSRFLIFQEVPMKLYLAGPLFTLAEKNFNVSLAAALRRFGHECFLPQDHEPREKTASAIFTSDVDGIDWADMVVANLDGPDPDSGTCWEIGYGYGKDKLLLNYRTDFRIHQGIDPINLMLTEAASETIYAAGLTIDELAAEINRHIIEIEKDVQRIVKSWQS